MFNEIVKKQLDTVNESIKLYGTNHQIPHMLIDNIFELYMLTNHNDDYTKFNNDNVNRMFLLIDKLNDGSSDFY